ncbi:hypothetical protein [uncultured Tateyamaria sp.]|uniref:hypothetical protein n=1 Tax=uncultured Tateyamaria sp. TaxID=455651 RepID=UPI002618DE8B|nr:hypothetical protein [uncultured Tateyamaria sp.]
MSRLDEKTTGSSRNDQTYVIGSGWWCSQEPDSRVNPKRGKLGTNKQREVEFFQIWLNNIKNYTSPSSIAVVDSASPIKPDSELRAQTTWIELPFNARHATDHIGQWSGWLRSVLMSGQYALATEADYFVYVEQDCLLKGERIIDRCLEDMRTGLMFGDGEGTPQPLQQSFFLIGRARLGSFLKNLSDIKARDSEISPEWKFVFASWRPFVLCANMGLLTRRKTRARVVRIARRFFFDDLPMGVGRSRPVPFDATYYYFQHGSEEEITQHLEALYG